jgi:hypothetical protein
MPNAIAPLVFLPVPAYNGQSVFNQTVVDPLVLSDGDADYRWIDRYWFGTDPTKRYAPPPLPGWTTPAFSNRVQPYVTGGRSATTVIHALREFCEAASDDFTNAYNGAAPQYLWTDPSNGKVVNLVAANDYAGAIGSVQTELDNAKKALQNEENTAVAAAAAFASLATPIAGAVVGGVLKLIFALLGGPATGGCSSDDVNAANRIFGSISTLGAAGLPSLYAVAADVMTDLTKSGCLLDVEPYDTASQETQRQAQALAATDLGNAIKAYFPALLAVANSSRLCRGAYALGSNASLACELQILQAACAVGGFYGWTDDQIEALAVEVWSTAPPFDPAGRYNFKSATGRGVPTSSQWAYQYAIATLTALGIATGKVAAKRTVGFHLPTLIGVHLLGSGVASQLATPISNPPLTLTTKTPGVSAGVVLRQAQAQANASVSGVQRAKQAAEGVAGFGGLGALASLAARLVGR